MLLNHSSANGCHKPRGAYRSGQLSLRHAGLTTYPPLRKGTSSTLLSGNIGQHTVELLARSSSPSASSQEQVKVPKPRNGPVLGPELGTLFTKYKRLQNGSDIRGIAMEGIPNEPVNLTPGAVYFIGMAFARWLARKGHESPRVAVGRDPRLSGALLEQALMAGLVRGGAKVVLVGLATTPCMFYSIISEECYAKGSIMLTASHMPWNANGLKFFTNQGGLDKADITALLNGAAQLSSEAGVMPGESWYEIPHLLSAFHNLNNQDYDTRDFRPVYAKFLRQLIIDGVAAKDNRTLPLLGFKIVVDAGNGAGGFFASEVLAPLGADTTGSRYLDPDGSFPNHIPNPEHPSAMASGSQAVLESGADLGIVFDTDVDRSAVVDRNGREINSNRFIALMSAITLREYPGSTIVTDSVTSNGLTDFITALGGKHFRYKRGYKNVISKGVQLNKEGVECHLMMETSGHGAIRENYFLDDGSYLAVKVIIEMARRQLAGDGDIGDLLAQLKEPAESKEFRIRINSSEHGALGAQALDRFYQWVTEGATRPGNWSLVADNHEGWRVSVDEGNGRLGWALLRQSLHDPILVLNVESEVEGGVSAAVQHMMSFLTEKCNDLPLDTSKLQDGLREPSV